MGVTQNYGSAGNVRFYGSSSAEDATFYNQVGGGTVWFNDSSTAGDGHFFIEDTGTATFGGHVWFEENSKGGTSDITVRQNAFSATIGFYHTSNAENAEITLENGSQAWVWVTNSANLGHANVDIGSASTLYFRESASAANATIRVRPGGYVTFTGANTSAANATFTLDGATVANGGTGSLGFTGGNAGSATFYVNGGTVSGAAGAELGFSNGANAGTARVIGGGGAVAGAGGARISLDPSSNASNATFTIGAGGYLNLAGFGDARVGSLDIAAGGAVYLGQTGLQIGALNTSNTISGPISGFVNNTNAKITKVGTGTLTLTGANTYYGLTKVDGGTLVINGTTPGAAEVNTGAMLMGTGTIGGMVTVKSGGTLAPGASPGKMTVGGLTLTGGSQLNFELGDAARDHIVLTNSGVVSLGGTLQVSLAGAFTPTLGQSYQLFEGSIGSISGAFQSIVAPTINGLTFNLVQNANSAMLQVITAPFLAGDYNGNGRVDAADYTAYRDALGTNTTLLNDTTPGTVTAADYAVWQTNFGAGPASSAAQAVPEPHSLIVLVIALLAVSFKVAGTLRVPSPAIE